MTTKRILEIGFGGKPVGGLEMERFAGLIPQKGIEYPGIEYPNRHRKVLHNRMTYGTLERDWMDSALERVC